MVDLDQESRLLRCLNRMNDKVARVDGEIWYHGLDINKKQYQCLPIKKKYWHGLSKAKSISKIN